MMKLAFLLQWPLSLIFTLFLRISTALPYRMNQALGRVIGRVYIYILPKRKHIITCNIKRCFPNFSIKKTQQTVHENIHAHGQGLMEASMAWWYSDQALMSLIKCKKITPLGILYVGSRRVSTLLILQMDIDTLIP